MPEITRETLLSDLRNLGIKSGDFVTVHSSMKSIGWVEGGVSTVIEALLDSVGPEGHLMIPLFHKMNGKTTMTLADAPTYLGLIPETFRKLPGVVRSPHPTHSVGIVGPRAKEIAESHLNSTSVGRNGPYHILAQEHGWVLHIGTDFNSCTIIHLAEVLAGAPYLDIGYPGYEVPLSAVLPDGRRVTSQPIELPADSIEFYRAQEEMDRRGMLRKGKFGDAKCVMARANEIIDVSVEMMKEDMGVFLCDNPECRVCPARKKLIDEWRKAGNK